MGGGSALFHLEDMMTLSIDSTACVSCGMCAERLPALFVISAVAGAAHPYAASEELVRLWSA